jgi:hypothetical protein
MNAHTPAPWTVVDRRTDGDIVSLDVCHEGQRLAPMNDLSVRSEGLDSASSRARWT